MSTELNPTTQRFARRLCETTHGCTGSCQQGRPCDCVADLEQAAEDTARGANTALIVVGMCLCVVLLMWLARAGA